MTDQMHTVQTLEFTGDNLDELTEMIEDRGGDVVNNFLPFMEPFYEIIWNDEPVFEFNVSDRFTVEIQGSELRVIQ